MVVQGEIAKQQQFVPVRVVAVRSHRRRRLAPPPPPPCFPRICSGQLDKENPSALISSGLLVQADEGVSLSVMDLIDVIYRRLP
ncbi:hypothetical protein F511_41436 [Dorcoceras hygrometricum]|uniref:Uncharacterized protein n=1 Tax=Dorcoceras hygrometricum TaxID=472368 RepID=A0A2Z7C5N0_9LAMI|nr:hypothetical protein F511_41436 [Dorcoceras hygrometricum]